MQRLIADLKADLPWVQGRKLSSIFFGGGTPSLFSGSAIGEILNAAEQLIGFESDIEITLEANPGTFEQQKFADFHSAGVNRLSIGVQSFNHQHLQRLGRIHDGSQSLEAIAAASSAGFNNFNIDPEVFKNKNVLVKENFSLSEKMKINDTNNISSFEELFISKDIPKDIRKIVEPVIVNDENSSLVYIDLSKDSDKYVRIYRKILDGKDFDEKADEELKKMVIDYLEKLSKGLVASSMVTDDGIIDPRDTRDIIGFCLSIINNIPIEGAREYGVFRL